MAAEGVAAGQCAPLEPPTTRHQLCMLWSSAQGVCKLPSTPSCAPSCPSLPPSLPPPAAQLSVFEIFNTMSYEYQQEAAQLVEYMSCPEGGCALGPLGGP